MWREIRGNRTEGPIRVRRHMGRRMVVALGVETIAAVAGNP